MKNKFMNLHIFEEGGNGGEGKPAGQSGNSGNGNGSQSGSAGYTFEQAEEIANNRAEKASRAALASFYRQQGLSEEQSRHDFTFQNFSIGIFFESTRFFEKIQDFFF